MRRRMITILLTSGCMMFLATGCSKAQIIKQYDNVLQSIGEKSITKDRKLQGERKLGEDSYVGSYKADYESFSGEEIVFGEQDFRGMQEIKLRSPARLRRKTARRRSPSNQEWRMQEYCVMARGNIRRR